MICRIGRGIVAAFVAVSVASCGGGGGGTDGGGSGGGGSNGNPNNSIPLQASFDTSALTFSAKSPFDTPPVRQRINGTVKVTGNGTVSGTLYVIVEVPANSFFTVPEALIDGGDSGHALVQVSEPAQMGVGTFDGTFRIRLCLNSQTCAAGSEISGSPQTISVHYTVGNPASGDTTVSPHTVLSGTPGYVILRGSGFTAGTTVSFAGTPAASVTYVNATQLRANYPALAPGKYAVTLNSGGTTFNGSVVAVAPTNYGYTWIPHPANPANVQAMVYDAQRQALVYSISSALGPSQKLVRYEYSANSWVQTASVDVQSLFQLHLSHDGSKIVALRAEEFGTSRLLELDPVTLAITRELPIDNMTWSFSVANDGNYVLAKRFPGSGGYLSPDLLSARNGTTITVNSVNFHSLETAASADGSKVFLVGESNTLGLYDTSNFSVTKAQVGSGLTSFNYPHGVFANLDGTRFVVLGAVFDQDLKVIGESPLVTPAMLLSADGKKLYVYDSGYVANGVPSVGKLRTFDVNAATTLPPATHPSGSGFRILAEVGAPMVFSDDPRGGMMALTPDGHTLFVCGTVGCVVQPVQ